MGIQVLLVLIALACVPCMLVVKTMVLRRQHLWKKHLVSRVLLNELPVSLSVIVWLCRKWKPAPEKTWCHQNWTIWSH